MANFNFNKVILGGRISTDVELKSTNNGTLFTQFSLAVNRKPNKEGKAETDFISCVAWRNTAEFISKFFKKGSSICVVGTIQTRIWEDKNNQKRYVTEVVVDEANFVDSKADNQPVQSQPAQSQPQFEELDDDKDLPF